MQVFSPKTEGYIGLKNKVIPFGPARNCFRAQYIII